MMQCQAVLRSCFLVSIFLWENVNAVHRLCCVVCEAIEDEGWLQIKTLTTIQTAKYDTFDKISLTQYHPGWCIFGNWCRFGVMWWGLKWCSELEMEGCGFLACKNANNRMVQIFDLNGVDWSIFFAKGTCGSSNLVPYFVVWSTFRPFTIFC